VVKTFLTSSHSHKVGDARTVGPDPLTVNNDSSHNHGLGFGSLTQKNTSAFDNHTHVYSVPSSYPSSTGNGGGHDHSMTKPEFARELAMRKQDGSTLTVGVTLTTENATVAEMWTENAQNSSTITPVSASFDWIAI
jgi:hypothetical protein